MEGQTRGPEGVHLGREPVAAIDRANGMIVVRLQGELDLFNAHRMREALFSCCEGRPQRLVVDLGEVTFLDSTALGVLIETSSRLGNPARLVLAAPSLETRRALEISGLDRHFSVRDTLQDALA